MKYYLLMFLLMTVTLCGDQFSIIPKKDFEVFRKIVENNKCEILNVQIMDYDVEGSLLVTWK